MTTFKLILNREVLDEIEAYDAREALSLIAHEHGYFDWADMLEDFPHLADAIVSTAYPYPA